jgi:hypothetical protein
MRHRLNWRTMRLHLTILVLLPTFLVLTRWQLGRALGGNGLSWMYTVEWPLFAVYALYVWWRLVREEHGVVERKLPRTARGRIRAAEREQEEDLERAAYNSYLDSLRVEEESRQARKVQ